MSTFTVSEVKRAFLTFGSLKNIPVIHAIVNYSGSGSTSNSDRQSLYETTLTYIKNSNLTFTLTNIGSLGALTLDTNTLLYTPDNLNVVNDEVVSGSDKIYACTTEKTGSVTSSSGSYDYGTYTAYHIGTYVTRTNNVIGAIFGNVYSTDADASYLLKTPAHVSNSDGYVFYSKASLGIIVTTTTGRVLGGVPYSIPIAVSDFSNFFTKCTFYNNVYVIKGRDFYASIEQNAISVGFNSGDQLRYSYPLASLTDVTLSDSEDLTDDDSPYIPAGQGETGGGSGDFDDTSDSIDIPDVPTISAVDSGMLTVYSPTISQIKSLANYMWSTDFDIDTFKKLFGDPMDAIIGLSILPVTAPISSSKEIIVGNMSTGVTANAVSAQYLEIDCGSVNVNEYWGAYLDYSPYTKIYIYLPYVGIHPLDIDDVMSKTILVKYHVDILSGACVCYVKCGDSVLYTFTGQCSAQIPINASNFNNIISGAIGIAGSIGSMVASGGMSAPVSIPSMIGSAVNFLKPDVEKSGSISGTGGLLGIQYPYLILSRPKQALPLYQNTFQGFPAHLTYTLSELSGYTEIEDIHLNNIPCTDTELNEIERLLKEGVVI